MKDFYFEIDNCVDRLYKEYLKYPKLIIACDHDDTVFDFHKKGHSYPRMVNLLKECAELGFYIVVYTASDKSRWKFIEDYWTDELGIKISTINENPIDLPYGNNGKIYYNILLDDRAGLGFSYEVLNKTVKKIKENLNISLDNDPKN
jgi:hypothetical protein